MNMDIPHIGPCSFSKRIPNYGNLECVNASSKGFVIEEVKKQKMRVFKWLEQAIQEKSGKSGEILFENSQE